MGMCLEAVKTLKLRRQNGQSFIAVFRDSPGRTRLVGLIEGSGFFTAKVFLTGSGLLTISIGFGGSASSSFCCFLEVLCLLNF